MRVAVIARSTLELRSACAIALSRLISDGHEVHAIIPNKGTSYMGLSKAHTLSTFGIDASNIHFVDGFDYCAITQSNADKINAWIKKLGPKLVFIPHWKSTNPDELILGRTSLIACRGIGNILMYEPQDNNNFVPSVLFPKSANRTDLNSDESESYESHRILLLDEVEMI